MPDERGGCGHRFRCCGCTLGLIVLITLGTVYYFTGTTLLDLFRIQRSRERAYEPVNCSENLKNISMALTAYLASNEAYPPSARWMDELANYIPQGNDVKKEHRTTLVFQCPAARALDTGAYGYAFNVDVSSKWADDVKSKETTVVVFDSRLLTRNAAARYDDGQLPDRHGDVANVLFADGSVKAKPLNH